jgi:hypothetical protein
VTRTGHPPDISSRLFTRAFQQLLVDVLTTNLAVIGAPELPVKPVEWYQDKLVALQRESPDPRLGHRAVLFASWDGAVGVHLLLGVQQADRGQLVDKRVRAAWVTASRLLNGLRAHGENYLALIVSGGHWPHFFDRHESELGSLTRLARGPLEAGVDESQLASITRELTRAAKEPAPEPEPGD